MQVVPETEYRANFLQMIDRCGDRTVIIPETIPHLETYRNDSLQRYNTLLKSISEEKNNCHLINLFDGFLPHFSDYYLDMGHPNNAGYQYIADTILTHIDTNKLTG